MSEKVTKKIRREIKKRTQEIETVGLQKFMFYLSQLSFKDRFKVCISILFTKAQ